MIRIWDLIVALDHGHFALVGDGDPDPANVPSALERALVEDGVGQAGDTLVVLSPHQNNLAMALRIELWSERPPMDYADWQEVFEASIVVGFEGLTCQSTTGSFGPIPIPDGLYAISVCGRGFIAAGWSGSTEPGDRWRLQLWPCSDRVLPARMRAWDGVPTPLSHPRRTAREALPPKVLAMLETPDLAEARTAVARVVATAPGRVDLLDSDVNAACYARSSPSELFATWLRPHEWLGPSGQTWTSPDGKPGAIVPISDEVDCPRHIIEVDFTNPPHQTIYFKWSWIPAGAPDSFDEAYLDRAATVIASFGQRADGIAVQLDRTTSATLGHSYVPKPWRSAFKRFWQATLLEGDRITSTG